LISLRLRTQRGLEADQLDITLADHDGALALPRRGELPGKRTQSWHNLTVGEIIDTIAKRQVTEQLRSGGLI